MFPKWDKTYSMNHMKIDIQHKKLFELAAKIEYMFDRPIVKKDLKRVLIELFYYMRDHFKDEEEYMRLIGYPDTQTHEKSHKEIIRSMIHLIKNIKTTNDLKEKLYVIVKKWLLEHLLYDDMKIEVYRKSLENNDLDFRESKHMDSEVEMYFYVCDCKGQIHDIPLEVHREIQNHTNKIRCKKCKKLLQFYKKESLIVV